LSAEYHPDRDTLDSFSRGALSTDEALWVEEHLRSGCALCQDRVDDLLRSLAEPSAPWPEPGFEDAADAAWIRIVTLLERRMAELRREREDAPGLLAELLDRPAGERSALIRSGGQLRTFAVCELLIEKSFEEGFREPERAVELAELAVEAAGCLDPASYGLSVIQDLRARAWAYLGNARRIASDLPGADQALSFAESLLREGSADPLEEARLLDLRASLLSDQGWFEQAAELLGSVIAIYEELRDPHRQGRALIGQGLFLNHAGLSEQAVERLTEGLSRIDWDEEPRLVLMARHNLAWCLNDSGRPEEARHLLNRFRHTYGTFPDPWIGLRLVWLEGRIAARLGQDEEAERAFREVRERFLEKGLCYDASMVALDLAALYLRQGRNAEVRQVAAEMLPTFLSQDVHRQAAAALAAFQQAVEMDQATPRLIQEVAAYLMRARKNPSLRFRS
jgi:tetratricopeptide (TPR) repeat protein